MEPGPVVHASATPDKRYAGPRYHLLVVLYLFFIPVEFPFTPVEVSHTVPPLEMTNGENRFIPVPCGFAVVKARKSTSSSFWPEMKTLGESLRNVPFDIGCGYADSALLLAHLSHLSRITDDSGDDSSSSTNTSTAGDKPPRATPASPHPGGALAEQGGNPGIPLFRYGSVQQACIAIAIFFLLLLGDTLV